MGGKKGRISLNCYSCGNPRGKGREKQSYCLKCHADRQREYRRLKNEANQIDALEFVRWMLRTSKLDINKKWFKETLDKYYQEFKKLKG